MERLGSLGFSCTRSSANFLFATHPDCDARELFEALKREGIYVRWWDSERIRQYMRITVGTDEEMEKLFAFLEQYLSKGE